MKTRGASYLGIVVVCAMLLAAWPARLSSQQSAAVSIDADDIGGVVTSANGPEAGVWVIAETTDLPTRFAKIVVTDDRGRYLIPDLPNANYSVWVRGYGLIDSPKVQGTPGKIINLTATLAPDAKAAAEYYPSSYWYSLLHIPAKNEFPGTGPKGNGIAEGIKNQAAWISRLKAGDAGCQACHQIGNKATRTIPAALGHFESSFDAWDRRTQSGQAGPDMVTRLAGLG